MLRCPDMPSSSMLGRPLGMTLCASAASGHELLKLFGYSAATVPTQLLGFSALRGHVSFCRREEFEQRKKQAEDLRIARLNRKSKRLASVGKSYTDSPLLEVGALTPLV